MQSTLEGAEADDSGSSGLNVSKAGSWHASHRLPQCEPAKRTHRATCRCLTLLVLCCFCSEVFTGLRVLFWAVVLLVGCMYLLGVISRTVAQYCAMSLGK